MEHLNCKQIEAVETTEGRVKVVAGAGSGKTRVIAYRYAYLVNELGIDSTNILCLTFTNKAAQEMKNRIGKLVASGNLNDFVCTIHGFCVKFLRNEIYRIGFPRNFIILDDEDVKGIAKQVIEETGLSRTETTVKKFLSEIARLKCWVFCECYVRDLFGVTIKRIEEYPSSFLRFIELQKKSFALDFNDLIFTTLYILEKYNEVRKEWQDKLNYIMVDEAQDCNDQEWKLVELLSKQYNNLCVVGDPDQAIYVWRGANPDVFVHFQADFEIVLAQNYRSTPNILNVANSIIKHNENRIPKELFTVREPSKIVMHYHGKSEKEEGQWIANQILLLEENGAKNDDFAILYRASYLSRFIELEMAQKKIKYTIWGGVRFFERREIKDALAYLRLLAFGDDISFRRIINVPSRKFGKASMEKLQALADLQKETLFECLKKNVSKKEFKNKNLQAFLNLFNRANQYQKECSISDLLDFLLTESGLKESLRMDDDEERLENITELMSSIKYYEQINREDEPTLENYLQDVALYTNADYRKDTKSVKLMTIHQAKGLEFPYVFVCGLSEGIFPSHRAIRERKKRAEEEERRLMYVATTRAEKALFFTESEGYSSSIGSNKYPSRFLTEIGDGLIEVEGDIGPSLFEGTINLVKQISQEINPIQMSIFCVGDTVVHKVFGEGVVEEVEQERGSYKVKFEKGSRNLVGRVLTKK